MAHYYANIQGSRGEATRLGTKNSGMSGHIRGWEIGGSVDMIWNEEKQRDEVIIYVTAGSNGGFSPKCLGSFALKKNGKGFSKI